MNKTHNIIQWAIFVFVLFIYVISTSHSINFWDSPEFIATSYKLQNSHPPGAPLYSLLSHLFISLFPVTKVAFAANLFSAICGAFTTLFLFKILIVISNELVNNEKNKMQVTYVSAITGSLCFAFCHSFWFASTEAEVYTLQSFMVTVILYLGLRYRHNREVNNLLLIVFLLGLSVGVHIMTFAVLFPVSLLIIMKNQFSFKKLLLSLVVAFLAYIIFNKFLFQGLIALAASFELYFVNSLGLFFNSGLILLYLIVLGVLIAFMRVAIKKSNKKLYYGAISAILFIVGYSTYSIALVRSETPISSNSGDVFSLISYINYDQYVNDGIPVLHGRNYNTPLDNKQPFIDGRKKYTKDYESGTYVLKDDGKLSRKNYNKDHQTYLPRMYHGSAKNRDLYQAWIDIKGKRVKTIINDREKNIVKPTVLENLSFFMKFQVGWLNLRYLLWNFVGVQNDGKGIGHPLSGNWASGINAIDKARIGDQHKMSQSRLNDASYNYYYFLPFILGIIGLVFSYRRNKLISFFALLVFLGFGIFITFYINQIPSEVFIRERDYILLISYLGFSIFICFGVIALLQYILQFLKSSFYRTIVAALFLVIPGLMLATNFNDHNRSENEFSRQLAIAYLNSCDENALLITEGDNATFPLLYMQEVEGLRTDVRVINYSMLGLDWYAKKLTTKVNNSEPVSFSKNGEKLIEVQDQSFLLKVEKKGSFLSIANIVEHLANDEKRSLHKGKNYRTFPTPYVLIEYNPEAEKGDSLVWKFEKNEYLKQDVLLLDIISQNVVERPVHFAYNGDFTHYLDLYPFTKIKGLTSQLSYPIPTTNIDLQSTYNLLMDSSFFENLENEEKHLNQLSKDISIEVLRPIFQNLILNLITQKHYREAKKVIGRCVKLMPNKIVPFREYMFDIGKSYYLLGEPEKAQEVIGKVIDNFQNDINLITSIKPSNVAITMSYAESQMNIYNIIVNELQEKDKEYYNSRIQEINTTRTNFEQWRLKMSRIK